MCLTTRIQKLENMLKATSGTIKVHTNEIEELKLNNSIPMEPIKTDGPIDTNAIFAKIKALEVQLIGHRETTTREFTRIDESMDQMKIDYKAYTDSAVSDLEDKLTMKLDNAIATLNHELERLRAEFEQHKNKDFKDLENRVTALEKKLNTILERLNNMGSGNGQVMDDGRIANLERRVQALEDALEGLKNDISRWIKELQDMINSKPDFDQIEKMI